MDGFYSICTKPYFINPKNKGKQFYMNEYELLTIILSVSVYQRYNGDCRIYLDAPAREYLEKTGILKLFNKGVRDFSISDKINPKIFWAAGKLYALKDEETASAMIDLDLIIWKDLSEQFEESDIFGIHREEIRNEIYPNPYDFRVKSSYKLEENLPLDELPLNTALLFIKDNEFRVKYAEKSIDFMENCVEENDNLRPMVFAEQRLITMMAKQNNKYINTMFNLAQDIGYQEYFTHIWGHKNILKYNYDERKKYINRIINRLKNEYPEAYEIALPLISKEYLIAE